MGRELGSKEPRAKSAARIQGRKTLTQVTIQVVPRRNYKRRGEASEAEFIARAARLDFRVAKPWGESDSYDAIDSVGRAFWRVQVKCATTHIAGRRYVVKGGGNYHNYTKQDIDFLAAHVVPEDIWYIIPVEAFEGKSMLHLCPHGTGEGKYEKYREAWCLLKCSPEARGWNDIPAVCRCRKELPIRCAVCPSQPTMRITHRI